MRIRRKAKIDFPKDPNDRTILKTAEATVDNPSDEADLEKTELKESLTNLNVDEKAEVKDSISDVEHIKRKGSASYLRKIKTNK